MESQLNERLSNKFLEEGSCTIDQAKALYTEKGSSTPRPLNEKTESYLNLWYEAFTCVLDRRLPSSNSTPIWEWRH